MRRGWSARLALAGAMACGLALAGPARADAPPYATTDTEIADRPELTSFLAVAANRGDRFNALGFDFDVPLGARWELTLVPRLAEVRQDGRRSAGLGDTEVAVKYLLKAETASWPAIALEPNLTFPTGGRRRGEGEVLVSLPVLIGKSFGPWRVSGEIAFEREAFRAGDDHAPVSLLVERAVSERLTLGVELANDMPLARPAHGSAEVNVGASWTFRDGLALQASVGRRFRSAGDDGAPDVHSCIALEVAF